MASSDSEEDGGIVWRETTGLPYGIMFICAYTKVHIPICRAGLDPAVVLFGQSGTPVPTVKIGSFYHKLSTSFKAAFALQGRWLRATARRRWDCSAGDHRSPLRGLYERM